MKKYYLLILIAISGAVHADNGTSEYVSLIDKPFQIISAGDESRVFVYGTQINNSGCTTPSSPVLFIGPNETIGKELYSALLTAKATGKKVKLITNGCYSNVYPIIFSMYLDQ
ncbi:hypothetical protein GCM10009092_25660 [Bowmanella denitrificans]|uniref:Uncharacterized protein n=1 Tax=Bowmanella denitrificans TaxID=366582 RepID=A0ABP3H400_9ALTE